jgi:hypothetical protein
MLYFIPLSRTLFRQSGAHIPTSGAIPRQSLENPDNYPCRFIIMTYHRA